MHVQCLRVADVIGTPDTVDKRLTWQHSTGVRDENVQQFELFKWKGHIFSTNDHVVLFGIELHVTHFYD